MAGRPSSFSKEYYQAVLDSISDAVFIQNAMNGDIVHVNARMCELYGCEYNQAIGLKINDFSLGNVPYSQHEALQWLQKAISEGPQSFKWIAKKLNGELFWAEVRMRYIESSNAIVVVSVRDISAVQRIDEEREITLKVLHILNEKSELHELIYELVNYFQKWINCDAVGIRIKQGNDYPYFEYSGFSSKFILKENYLCNKKLEINSKRKSRENAVYDCMCGNVISGRTDSSKPYFTNYGSFYSNDIEQWLSNISEKDNLGNIRNSCFHEGYKSIALIPLRTGNLLHGLIQINNKKPGLFDPNKIGFIEELSGSIAMAISNRISIELIEDAEKRYKTLFNNVNDVIILHDLKGQIIDINTIAIERLGYTKDEFLQMNLTDIIPNEIAQLLPNRMQALITEGSIIFESQHVAKDGNIYEIEANSKAYYINGEWLIYSISRDITYRKKMELELLKAKEEAEESNRLKTIFLNNMSHEIRTPMNAIIGFSDLMEKNFDNKEKLLKFTTIIKQRSSDLLEIINDILEISKIEAGQIPVHIEETNLNELISELSDFFSIYRQKINKNNIDLIISHQNSELPIIILIDRIKLKQILINLIYNAFKFTEKGEISFGYTMNKETINFYVSDTGIGIEENKIDLIFDRFVQIEKSNTKNLGGFGLGLAIAKAYVELLKGEIKVESKLGEGSKFSFKIPYSRVMRTESNKSTLYDIDYSIFKGKSILIVEDDEINCQYLKEILADTNFKIQSVETGEEAIEFVKMGNLADVVLMDIRLPGITGYKATTLIKEINNDIKVIAQTAYAAADDKEKAFQAGCSDYISKPVNANLLLSKIYDQLSK